MPPVTLSTKFGLSRDDHFRGMVDDAIIWLLCTQPLHLHSLGTVLSIHVQRYPSVTCFCWWMSHVGLPPSTKMGHTQSSHTPPKGSRLLVCIVRIMMKSRDISISGYRLRDSNPGFRGNLRYNYKLRYAGCIKIWYSLRSVTGSCTAGYHGILGSNPGANIRR